MATYVVGDLQGCFLSLQALLQKFGFQREHDRVILAGDLVNRGTGSLAVLRWAFANRGAVNAVLGNHDLHLLALAFGNAKRRAKDTLDEVMRAPDRAELLQWLRRRPMLIETAGYAVVHAGLHPLWTMPQARELARELESAIQGDTGFLEQMYGSEPSQWHALLKGTGKLRFAVNAMTRMRMLRTDLSLDFDWKGEPGNATPGLLPWFDARPADARPPIVFGHWSALGLLVRNDVIALDTGCVWGGALSALRLDDRAVFQVPSHDPAAPFDE